MKVSTVLMKGILALWCVCVITACGWQLRGVGTKHSQIVWPTINITGERALSLNGRAFILELEKSLELMSREQSQPNENTAWQLTLKDYSMNEFTTSLNQYNRSLQHSVEVRVTFVLSYQNGETQQQWELDDYDVQFYNYNENNILANANELQVLLNEIHSILSHSILRLMKKIILEHQG